MGHFLILLRDDKPAPDFVDAVLHADIGEQISRRRHDMLVPVLFIRTVVAGQADLHKLECLVDKLLFSHPVLRLAVRSHFAQIGFAKFVFGKVKEF